MPNPQTHITTSGGLISAAFIETIREPESRQPGTEPASFAMPTVDAPASRSALEDDIAAAWELLLERWDAVYADIHTMSVSDARRRWILPLFEVLDFEPAYLRGDVVLDEAGKLRYPLSHRGWPEDGGQDGSEGSAPASAPVLHTVAPDQPLDERAGSGRGVKAKSPHDMLQAFLNASADDRWAVLTNGILLRLLREYHHTFTKGYVQFDLESIFETRNYGDFRALYRMAHASRLIAPAAVTVPGTAWGAAVPGTVTPIERFYQDSLAAGVRVGDDLRDQVREAIEILGNGFLRNNPALLRALTTVDNPATSIEQPASSFEYPASSIKQPAPSTHAFYAEILHTIYRILFLLFAEQRGMLPGRDSLYAETYAIARLRARAEGDIPRDDDFTDLWEGLRVTFRMVRDGVPDLGVFGYDGMLFADNQTPLLNGSIVRARHSARHDPSNEDDPTPDDPANAGDDAANASRLPGTPGIRNSDLLHAIRGLTLIEREGVLQRISYADLGVEELGSIYESLLDYTPRITADDEVVEEREVPPNTFILDPRGSERKTTGSYYTHDSLVNALIKSALLPVARDRLAEAGLPVIATDAVANAISTATTGLLEDYAGLTDAQRKAGEAAILGLTVCDPAAGSGHFLVKANDVLGAELARVRTGDEYPTETQIQAAKRDVLAHCIYAVDLNPMAVELCKVSLWINASVRDRPLSFLDHHIKCGNSLVGATPDLMAEGVPYEAFDHTLEGNDRERAKEIRKQNREERRDMERAGGYQPSLLRVTVLEPDGRVTQYYHTVSALAQEDPQVARERYEAYLTAGEVRRKTLVADAWTAAYFWPITAETDWAPTHGEFVRLRDEGPEMLSPEAVVQIEALADRYRFFHWHLEFPDIFEVALSRFAGKGGAERSSAGFDVIVGNVPWERIKLQEKEFFADKDARIANAGTAAARRKWIKRLPETDPALHAAYRAALRESEAVSHFLRESGRYPLSAVGDINTYQVFAGLVRQIVAGHGRVGIVVPTGIATDYYNQDYFAALVENQELVSLYDFENRQGLFPGVHRNYRFSLMTIAGSVVSVTKPQFAFFLSQVDSLSDKERRFALSVEDLQRINPNTKSCPVFRTRRDADLTSKLYRAAPVLVNKMNGKDPWRVSFLRMFDMSNDSNHFNTSIELKNQGLELNGNHFVNGSEYLPLYEGKFIAQFDHRHATLSSGSSVRGNKADLTTSAEHQNPCFFIRTRYWVKESTIAEKLDGIFWERNWFVSFRRITRAVDRRSARFSISPYAAYADTSAILLPQATPCFISCLVANMNSFVVDYVSRQKISGIHLDFYNVEQLPVLLPHQYTSNLLRFAVPRVLELTYTAWDLRPFADDVWAEALGDTPMMRALLDQWEANREATQAYPREAPFIEPGWPRPPFTWDEVRRAQLRADLDGLYAHLYGLTREELAYILETFPIVKRKDEAQYGEFRTKRMVLEAYESLK
jgi:hypothetical protein